MAPQQGFHKGRSRRLGPLKQKMLKATDDKTIILLPEEQLKTEEILYNELKSQLGREDFQRSIRARRF